MSLTDLIPPQYRLIAYGILAAGLFGTGFYTAHRFDASTISDLKAAHANEALAATAKALKSGYEQGQADNAAALASAQSQEHTRVVYRTITKEVKNANVTDCDLGPDFGRVWGLATDQARGAATAGATGAGHATVP